MVFVLILSGLLDRVAFFMFVLSILTPLVILKCLCRRGTHSYLSLSDR